jgi:DNA-binding beta-propeller fold protein YncE
MSNRSYHFLAGALFAVMIQAASAATFGTSVAIGGQGADIALDEPRGVLYVADFTANRIDVVTLADNKVHSSINVNPQPGSLSLSPDGQSLVVVHFGNFASPAASNSALTVIHLADGTRQTFGLSYPPLGVAFGNDGLALIATTTDFELFDPITGSLTQIETFAALAAKTLPQPLASFPPNVISASMNTNASRTLIVGLTDSIQFSYNTSNHQVYVIGYVSSPLLAPRVVSVSGDGSYYLAGWALYLCGGSSFTGCTTKGPQSASFLNPSGILNKGSHAIDGNSNTVYAQIPATATDAPTLMIADADNLTIRDRIQIPENLAGKSVLNAAATVMYSVSDSGVMVLPVGTLAKAHRVQATQPDLIFRGDFCNQSKATQSLTIVDQGGGQRPLRTLNHHGRPAVLSYVRRNTGDYPGANRSDSIRESTGHDGWFHRHKRTRRGQYSAKRTFTCEYDAAGPAWVNHRHAWTTRRPAGGSGTRPVLRPSSGQQYDLCVRRQL